MLTAFQQWDKTNLIKYPGYGFELSDGEAPVLELWGMLRTSLLLLLPGPPKAMAIVPVRVPSLTDFLTIYFFSNHLTMNNME